MKWSFPACATLLMSMLATAPTQAAEYKSVGANPAILYNAPSERGRAMFIAPRGMPVEIIFTQNGWSKVRDATGDLSWIEAVALTSKRNVIVTVANLKLHVAPEENAIVVTTVDKGVLLELLAPPAASWVKLRHKDGPVGFAKTAEVWGE